MNDQNQRNWNLTQQSCIVFHYCSVILKGSGPSIQNVYAFAKSSYPLIILYSLCLKQKTQQASTLATVYYLHISDHFFACLIVFFLQRKESIDSYIFLQIIIIIICMTNLKQGINTTSDLLRQNEILNKELISIKNQLYQIYQENLKLRQIVKQQESDKLFYKECENQIARLKVLVSQNNQKRKDIPNEREEIKDRIIMKLQDQLINTKIQLKEAQFQLSKLHRHK